MSDVESWQKRPEPKDFRHPVLKLRLNGIKSLNELFELKELLGYDVTVVGIDWPTNMRFDAELSIALTHGTESPIRNLPEAWQRRILP